jgi:hypothetical protein
MSTITKTLPGIDTDFICLTQGVAAGDFMVFNGTGIDPATIFPYAAGGYFRTLSFTSPDNLAGCSIVIHGSCNGATITETIGAGPNNDTIYSVKSYDYVTQIQINTAPATNLSVGSGSISVIPYTFGDRVSSTFSCVADSFGAFITNQDSVSISVSGTFRDPAPAEVLALIADPQGGVFTINSGVTTAYRLTSTESRGVKTVFFHVASTGVNPITLDLFTA